MAGKQYTKYQQGIISRYYEHFDTIQLNRLSELVTELYIAKNTAGEDKLWDKVGGLLVKLKVPAKVAEHLMQKRQVELLAQHLTEWLGKASR